ncbi:MAG: hypothetical protein ACF8SC_03280 [Phycisphaerales bacterium JB037]
MSDTQQSWSYDFDRVMTSIARATSAGIQSLSAPVLLDMARTLDEQFREAPAGSDYRRQLAIALLGIAAELDRRLAAADLDEDGLPVLDGLDWDANSPLAGVLDDVPPFGNRDQWAVAAGQEPRPRPPRPRRPRPRSTPQRPQSNGRQPRRWNGPRVAPPSGAIRAPEELPPYESLANQASQVLDGVGFGIGAIGEGAAVLEIYGAGAASATAGMAAFVAGILSLPLAAVAGHLGLSAANEIGAEMARRRAFMEGFADGLQNLAMQCMRSFDRNRGRFEDRSIRDLRPEDMQYVDPPSGPYNNPRSQFAASIMSMDAAREGYDAGRRQAMAWYRARDNEQRYKGRAMLLGMLREWGAGMADQILQQMRRQSGG